VIIYLCHRYVNIFITDAVLFIRNFSGDYGCDTYDVQSFLTFPRVLFREVFDLYKPLCINDSCGVYYDKYMFSWSGTECIISLILCCACIVKTNVLMASGFRDFR